MKKIIFLILTCALLFVSIGALASDGVFSETNKTAELRHTLDVVESDTVIEETTEGKMKVSVKVKNYGDAQKSATLIAAYKEKATGAVYSIDVDEKTIPFGTPDNETLSAQVLIPTDTDKYEFSYYVWDDLTNMSAIGNTAPHTPENFKVESATNSTVTLKWDASKDDAGVITYNIYCGDEKIADTTATTFTHSCLEEDTTYSYSVEAVDGGGLSSEKTDAVTGKTLKVARINMSDVYDYFEGEQTLATDTYDFGSGLSLYVNSTASGKYDPSFTTNKTADTFGFVIMTDSDGVEKKCLGSNNIEASRIMINIPAGEVLSSLKKTMRITILDNEAKTIQLKYSPNEGSRKNIEFTLTGSGKWVTFEAIIPDSYTSSSGKTYHFELGKNIDKGEIYISDIEIIGGDYVPKE